MTNANLQGKPRRGTLFCSKTWLAAAVLGAFAGFAAEPAAEVTVTVDLASVLGPVKPMHAVNGGPTVKKPGGDGARGEGLPVRGLQRE